MSFIAYDRLKNNETAARPPAVAVFTVAPVCAGAMTADLSDDDRGKTVVSGTERVGVVTDVRGDTAYVDPDWDHVDEGLASALGWERGADDDQPLDESSVTAVRNSEVRLRENL